MIEAERSETEILFVRSLRSILQRYIVLLPKMNLIEVTLHCSHQPPDRTTDFLLFTISICKRESVFYIMTDAISMVTYFLPFSIVNNIDHYMGMPCKEASYDVKTIGFAWFDFQNSYHSIFHPARIGSKNINMCYFEVDQRIEEWWYRGKRHRLHKPAIIIYDEDCDIFEKQYWHNGKLHRAESLGPAKIGYYGYINPQSEEYYFNGTLHRTQGPARIRYGSKGIRDEQYWIQGKLHRIDGPAKIERKASCTKEKYYYQGLVSRTDKPAIIIYNPDGTILTEEYWNNGCLYKIITSNSCKHEVTFMPDNGKEGFMAQDKFYKVTVPEIMKYGPVINVYFKYDSNGQIYKAYWNDGANGKKQKIL